MPTFPARRLAKTRAEHPNALVAAHPECPADVLGAMADFIGSTSAIVDWCTAQDADEFIVMTGERRAVLARKTFAFEEVLFRRK